MTRNIFSCRSVSTMTTYPVVTPSATSFATPRPTPLNLIPHANYSNYCTAGQSSVSITFSSSIYLRSVSDKTEISSPACVLYWWSGWQH